jgi:hypothetical protein
MNNTKTICKAFKADPSINPISKRRISRSVVKGIYWQFAKICKLEESDLDEKRANLVRVLKKVLQPVLHSTNSLENRIKFYNILQKYFKDLQPCLYGTETKQTLIDQNNIPVVSFTRQIGTESKWGTAFMNTGVGLGKLFKFSCKTQWITKKATAEIDVLNTLNKVVLDKQFQHFPITFKIMTCTDEDDEPYALILNELADCDIENWLKRKRSVIEYESVLTQLMLTIYYFQKLGFYHNDLHLGNALIHKVDPGGYWCYKHNSQEIYVPNVGFLLVLWDFGETTTNKTSKRSSLKNPEFWKKDFDRPFDLIRNTDKFYKNEESLVSLPLPFKQDFIKPYMDGLELSYSRTSFINYIFGKQPFHNVLRTKPSKNDIINKIPFIM